MTFRNRLFRLFLTVAPLGATVGCFGWIALQSQFAEPFVDKSLAGTRIQLERAMAREIDLGWLLPRVQTAF
jgi:hypothetical protein